MKTEIKTFVRHMPQWNATAHSEGGWGNGYVGVPKGHVLHGVDTDALYSLGIYFPESEITWANYCNWEECPDDSYWWFGFDTCHLRNTLENWPKERVVEAAERLAELIGNAKVEEYTVTIQVMVLGSSKKNASRMASDSRNWIHGGTVEVK